MEFLGNVVGLKSSYIGTIVLSEIKVCRNKEPETY